MVAKPREIIIALSLKHNNDWDKMFKDIQNRTEVEDEWIAKAKEVKNAITVIDTEYPEGVKRMPKPPFVLYEC